MQICEGIMRGTALWGRVHSGMRGCTRGTEEYRKDVCEGCMWVGEGS